MDSISPNSSPRLRYPSGRLTLALATTLLMAAWLAWTAWDSRRTMEGMQRTLVRFEELRGRIVHLDEVLTMSARMAAATGDLEWEKRYQRHEPLLDAAIKETLRLSPDPSLARPSAVTDAANLKLVEMEGRAFELVRSGQAAAGAGLLSGAEYERHKQTYAKGMTELLAGLHGQFEAMRHARRRQSGESLAIAAVAGVIAVTGWLVAMRRLAGWRRDLMETMAQLRDSHVQLSRARDELEHRVQERTTELAEKNEGLTKALAEVKELSGLLPVCSYCKKIRDDGDYWHSVENYVMAHTKARFSHSICPSCEETFVKPELERLAKSIGLPAAPSSPRQPAKN